MTARVSLRRKLVMSIVTLLVSGFLFVIGGTYLYISIGLDDFYEVLSPEALEVLEKDWVEEGAPPQEILEEIALAHEEFVYPFYENEFLVFSLLSVLVMVVGAVIAWHIAKRLTLPLETASVSAKEIAQGDFLHDMDIPEDATVEIVSLKDSFSFLTKSLQKMEDNVRYTSASIAHELRTPLTVIQGYIQGIRDGVFDADDEQLGLILAKVEGLTRLVDDLKLISLAETRDLHLDVCNVDLNACVGEAVAFMRPQFEKEQRDIKFEPYSDGTFVLIDAERIKQAVIALLNNALRYGGADSECRVKCMNEQDSSLILVCDTGDGFSEIGLQRATDRFWRGDSSRARESGGSGLGLAVVNTIAKAHDGSLELRNASEGGAIAQINLPNKPLNLSGQTSLEDNPQAL